MLVSGEQGRDLAIDTQVSILPQTPLPSRLPHNIEWSSRAIVGKRPPQCGAGWRWKQRPAVTWWAVQVRNEKGWEMGRCRGGGGEVDP